MKQILVAALFAVALVSAACAQPAKPAPSDEGWRKIEITAVPAAPDDKGVGASYGKLIFRGGLKLTSPDSEFGGWASLKFGKNGRLIGLSDEGHWLSLHLDLDPNTAALIGVSDAQMAQLRDLEGAELQGKINSDSEGLAHLPDGRFAVSFEHMHRIWFYDLDGAGPRAPATAGPPVKVRDLEANQGLESVTIGPDGDLFAGSEERPPGEHSSRFYRYKLGAPPEKALIAYGPAQTARGNALVDMDQLPDGDLVALERFYFPLTGYRTAIRRYQITGLNLKKPKLSGPLLASMASPLNIDNFEGIAALALPDGATRLYIISDDNFSKTQQTLLYAFDLPAPAKPAEKKKKP